MGGRIVLRGGGKGARPARREDVGKPAAQAVRSRGGIRQPPKQQRAGRAGFLTIAWAGLVLFLNCKRTPSPSAACSASNATVLAVRHLRFQLTTDASMNGAVGIFPVDGRLPDVERLN
jgi:hypothetical protein